MTLFFNQRDVSLWVYQALHLNHHGSMTPWEEIIAPYIHLSTECIKDAPLFCVHKWDILTFMGGMWVTMGPSHVHR